MAANSNLRLATITQLILLSLMQITVHAQPSIGLVGFWPFEGNANDLSGLGHHGTVNGATLSIDRFGNLNNAYSFDGNDDIYISTIGSHSVLTVSLWVKIDNNQSSWSYLFDYGLRRAGINFVSGTTQVKYLIDYNTNSPYVVLSPGVWHHVVLSSDWSNQKLNFYVDRVPYSVDVSLVNTEKTGNDLYIGSENHSQYFFTGALDDIRVYNRVLLESEVSELFYESVPTSWNRNGNNIYYTLGNVGVGTNAPVARFHLLNNVGGDQVRLSSGIGTIRLTQSMDKDDLAIISGDSSKVYMKWTETGLVGIGKSTPEYKLDVNGPVNASSFLINGQPFSCASTSWSNSGSNVYLGSGNVGIGISNPQNKLDVNGTVHAREVKVDLTGWPDYVLDKQYTLLPLKEVKQYINQNGHLPEMPSAKEVETDGLQLGQMNALLLKKIEELTLHVIRQQEEIEQLKRALKNE